MKIDIITLFPKMFEGPLTESIIARAQKKGLVKIKTHQLRDWAINSYGQVDNRSYGGGAGMIMRVDVANKALKKVGGQKGYKILLTPKGKKFDQKLATKLSKKKHLVFLCPHYEGYDHRIESLVNEKVSIGDYILTGGELPAAVIIDSVVRLIPRVISKESLKEESFSKEGYLEYPQYTRPEVFEAVIGGKKVVKCVPKVLLSGNHKEIAMWRSSKAK